MAYNSPIGFLCYNNADLVRDGHIWPYLEKSLVVNAANLRKLKKPRKGTSYRVVRDANDNIIQIWERRKQVPASKIKLEILFSKVLRNAISSPIGVGDLAAIGWLGAGSAFSVGLGVAMMTSGGITSGITELTYQICDSETKVNVPFTITEEILETGIIELDGYPISVFGFIKEHIEKDSDGKETSYGFMFSSDDLAKLGKFSSGMYEGNARRDITGATDDKGLFGGKGAAEVTFECTGHPPIVNSSSTTTTPTDCFVWPEQENIFIDVIKDVRTFKFRADNTDAKNNGYPFSARDGIDVTSKKIRIKTKGLKKGDLKVGDVIYGTYCIASIRHLRQNVRHWT